MKREKQTFLVEFFNVFGKKLTRDFAMNFTNPAKAATEVWKAVDRSIYKDLTRRQIKTIVIKTQEFKTIVVSQRGM